jgi:hypothetical protein
MPDETFPVRRRTPQDVRVVGAERRRYGGQDDGDDCANTGSVSALRSPDLGEWRSCLITTNSQRANPAGHPRDGLAYCQDRRHSSPHRALPSQPTSDLIADAPQRRQQLFLNGVKEAIDRRRLAPKIAATAGGTDVMQTS